MDIEKIARIIKPFREGQAEAVILGDPNLRYEYIKEDGTKGTFGSVRKVFRCINGKEEYGASEKFRVGLTIFAPGEGGPVHMHENSEEFSYIIQGKGVQLDKDGKWNCNGGGTLMRTGCHPLSAMLWLKQQEAKTPGETITVASVSADCGVATRCLKEDAHKHIVIQPEDVEDFGVITITFSDGTKCVTIATDTVLGGPKNYVEIYANNTALNCNITPTDILDTYFQDEEGLDDVYIAPRMPMKLGWNKAWLCDAEIRGYTGELQDFMETIANDTQPVSDFALAYETTRILYAAYQSAEEGRRIDF